MNTMLGNILPKHAPDNYVLLRAGSLQLLMKQKEVRPAERLDVLPQPLDGSLPGVLHIPGDKKQRCFFALSETMNLLPECPSDRFVTTSLVFGDESEYWCWSEVRVLVNVALDIQPIPRSILPPHAPLQNFVEQDGNQLAFVCDARQMGEFVLGQRK